MPPKAAPVAKGGVPRRGYLRQDENESVAAIAVAFGGAGPGQTRSFPEWCSIFCGALKKRCRR